MDEKERENRLSVNQPLLPFVTGATQVFDYHVGVLNSLPDLGVHFGTEKDPNYVVPNKVSTAGLQRLDKEALRRSTTVAGYINDIRALLTKVKQEGKEIKQLGYRRNKYSLRLTKSTKRHKQLKEDTFTHKRTSPHRANKLVSSDESEDEELPTRFVDDEAIEEDEGDGLIDSSDGLVESDDGLVDDMKRVDINSQGSPLEWDTYGDQ